MTALVSGRLDLSDMNIAMSLQGKMQALFPIGCSLSNGVDGRANLDINMASADGTNQI